MLGYGPLMNISSLVSYLELLLRDGQVFKIYTAGTDLAGMNNT
jgi:hypothetical protein